MIVSLHQPDFLPYSGFWFKLAHSDVMDLRTSAQIVKSPGYQRRVKMRDKWTNVVLAEGQSLLVPIDEVRIKNRETRTQLINTLRGRYNAAPYRKQRLDPLCDAINDNLTDMLWEFNVELLHYVRDELAILTPFNISGPVKGSKDDGVLEILARYPECTTYLSGTGAKKYMSDTSKFDAAGIDVEWSRHAPVTGDSIVTVMMDYADPMEIVMREKGEDE